MTTTNMFQGLDTNSKNSSRVLRPPGGSTSNIFGEPAPATKEQALEDDVKLAAKPEETAEQIPTTETKENANGTESELVQAKPTPGRTDLQEDEKTENDELALANKSKNRGRYNPITGEEYGAEKQPSLSHNNNAVKKPPQDDKQPGGDTPQRSAMPQSAYHSSTRVRQPPGGASQGIW